MRDRTRLLLYALFVCCAATVFAEDPTIGLWTRHKLHDERPLWRVVTSDSTGQYLAAASAIGNGADSSIYLSKNYGASWSRSSSPYNGYVSINSDASGQYLTAGMSGVYLMKSADHGTTWQQEPNVIHYWIGICSSHSGQNRYIAALRGAGDGGVVYSTTDYGTTWALLPAPPIRYWTSIACDSTGTKVAATATRHQDLTISATEPWDGGIYVSADSGATFTKTDAPNIFWKSIVSDSSGRYLVAIGLTTASGMGNDLKGPGTIFRSTDFGADWTSTSPTLNWTAIACDYSGQYLAAAVSGGGIYLSTDYAETWAISGAPARTWMSIASDSTGNYLVAVADAGQGIYTYNRTAVDHSPTVSPTAPPTLLVTARPSSRAPTAQTAGPTLHPTLALTVAPSSRQPAAASTLPPILMSTSPPSSYKPSTQSTATAGPSVVPTTVPSAPPSATATTARPSALPSMAPTAIPTSATPSIPPTAVPSPRPTVAPTATLEPTTVATSAVPSPAPTPSSMLSAAPSTRPTSALVPPTTKPTAKPTLASTNTVAPSLVTALPSILPTAAPSLRPTAAPTVIPTIPPTMALTSSPSTVAPTQALTTAPPSLPPIPLPTSTPTAKPTSRPTKTPTAHVGRFPTMEPTSELSLAPTSMDIHIPLTSTELYRLILLFLASVFLNGVFIGVVCLCCVLQGIRLWRRRDARTGHIRPNSSHISAPAVVHAHARTNPAYTYVPAASAPMDEEYGTGEGVELLSFMD